MTVYYDSGRTYPTPRLHPYAAAAAGQSGYVDFMAQPDLIPHVLEDFRPFADKQAIQTFYEFLKWINSPQSQLATNDCALRAPQPHQDRHSQFKLSAHGRVFVLFRNLHLNSSPTHADWLISALMHFLATEHPDIAVHEGVVGVTQNPALQVAISNGHFHADSRFEARENDPGLGKHAMLSFWAYGDTEAHAFENLDRVFRCIWTVTTKISEDILQGIQAEAE